MWCKPSGVHVSKLSSAMAMKDNSDMAWVSLVKWLMVDVGRISWIMGIV